VMLSRRSTVPLPLPFDPAKAVSFLERAGEVASRAGGFAEAGTQLQSAIAIAAEEEHSRLYEKLGDCAAIGDAAIEAYRHALDLWRREGEHPPLVGARLLRKMLTSYMRWQSSVGARPSDAEVADMRARANRVAQAAGDEGELWRVRVADLFWPTWTGADVSEGEVESGRLVALEAATYFEKEEAWVDFSAALDAYISLSRILGKHAESIEAAMRRRRARNLPSLEQGDILGVLTWSYLDLAEYQKAVDVMRQTLGQVRPGEPVAHLGFATSVAVLAASLGGQWQELGELDSALQHGWDQLQHDPRAFVVMRGYFAALHIALAREDRAAADAALAVLRRMVVPDWQVLARLLLAAYWEDDPRRLGLDTIDQHEASLLASTRVAAHTMVLALMFLSDRGVPADCMLLDAAATLARRQKIDPLVRCIGIAQALATHDSSELAQTIENAEHHGLIPHAARMRIVLAQMANDPAPLEQARPVLERLGDRQFLRRLEEVTAACRA